MKRIEGKQKPSVVLYMLATLGLFVLTIIISYCFNRVFVLVGFTENQATHISGMIEGIVASMAAGLVMYQLRFSDYERKHQIKIEEASFLLQYNQAFIQDPNMTEVEQTLEQYAFYNAEGDMITPENRQKFINYLVYLEGMAPLILNGVLSLESIDDLMAYRFFLALNSPQLQTDQLTNPEFAPYYRGCFKAYKMWYAYRTEHGYEIPLEETSLSNWKDFEKYAS